MQRNRPLSGQAQAVIAALAHTPEVWRYGYDLCQQTGIKAGSMYPILIRLADRGLLEASWEPAAPAGRPARHLYRLTGDGLRLASRLGVDRSTRGARTAARSIWPEVTT